MSFEKTQRNLCIGFLLAFGAISVASIGAIVDQGFFQGENFGNAEFNKNALENPEKFFAVTGGIAAFFTSMLPFIVSGIRYWHQKA